MGQKLRIRNWRKWQSYRSDRGQPPWIKVHRRLLRDVDWISLTDAQRGQLIMIWLLAADHDGVIPASPEVIRKFCCMDDLPDFDVFIEAGFIEHFGSVASPRPQDDETEYRIQSKETEAEKSKETDTTVSVIFKHWQSVMNSSRSKLTPDRIKKIKSRLKEGYTAKDCKKAIDGCRSSDFHMGKNDKGRVYNSIDLIFRTGDKLEGFIGNNKPEQPPSKYEEIENEPGFQT